MNQSVRKVPVKSSRDSTATWAAVLQRGSRTRNLRLQWDGDTEELSVYLKSDEVKAPEPEVKRKFPGAGLLCFDKRGLSWEVKVFQEY